MIDSSPATFYLAGPTAVGKSEIAVILAERLGAEIVGCDAYQIYRGLPILTAQPEAPLLRRVPHHLTGEVALTETMDVGRYVATAQERITEIHSRGRSVIVAGGTGMYLRALTRGLAELPQADAALREELESTPIPERLKRLKGLDPVAYDTTDLQNPRRVTRALEVCILTGRRFSDFLKEWETLPQDIRGVFLDRPREELNERINRRTVAMFEEGVLDEVAGANTIGPTAAKTLGLHEIQQVLAGTLDLAPAISRIQQITRQYAKRQVTWFRREQWMVTVPIAAAEPAESVASRVQQALGC